MKQISENLLNPRHPRSIQKYKVYYLKIPNVVTPQKNQQWNRF